MTKRLNILLLIILGTLFMGVYLLVLKTADIPERPPTFDELMILAEKDLAKNSLINSYIFSQKEGVGFQNIMTRAETGETKAELMACYLLISGIGVRKDQDLGYSLCENAAEKGSATARANLIYRDFKDDPKNMNWQETYDDFNALMDIKPSLAHRGLQFLYRQNHSNASGPMMFHHLEQAVKYKNTNAMIALSEFDLRITPKRMRNPARAEKNLKKAYSLNDFDAGYMLALEYREGSKLEKDTETYVSMIKRMANFLHPASMGELAYIYSSGNGATKDEMKSNALFLQAAKFGDSYSQKMIAHHLLFGPEETRDYETGIRYLEDQAQNGSVKAMTTLADHYVRPEIDDPDNKHVIWRSEAAMRGDPGSQEMLGMVMMETGYIEAMQPYIKVLEKAHKDGFSDASYLLARHYRAASGVRRNLVKAQQILSKVAHLDDPRITQEIDIIDGYISHFGSIEAVPAIIHQ